MRCALAGAALALLAATSAAQGVGSGESRGASFATGARSEGEAGRKYAPDRPVDLQHLRLDVTPNFDARTIRGQAMIRFSPISKATDRLTLDAVDLSIDSITGEPAVRDLHVAERTLEITFERVIQPGESASVTIGYHAEPQQGLYFRTPKAGYPAGDEHLWTQGETHEASYWYPSFDYPNEKFTSEVICRVPEGMTARSNGRLVGQERGEDGLIAWHWMQEQPHPNYLVALVAGRLTGLSGEYRGIPLAFWTTPSQAAHAERAFSETPAMMAFFEQEIGVPYPWAKYEQAAVQDFLYGGMENTSLTVLTERVLLPPEVENAKEGTDLIAHELAHQWFGDYLTCKDWSHIWLNEGFATYYAGLFEGQRDGDEAMRYGLWGSARRLSGNPNDPTAMVKRDYVRAFDQFDELAYEKGGWVLRMLRTEVGDEAFRRGVKLYLERHALGSVVTEDLNRAMEEVSGRSLDRFFDQWVYHGGVPELGISYEWDGSAKLAHVRVGQAQKVSDDVLLFDVPLTVRFEGAGWSREETVRVRDAEQDFYFKLSETPKTVRVDPEQRLLAKVVFNPGRAMLLAQLRDADDGVARAAAAQALGGMEDRETVNALARTLGGDNFFGARIEAAQALRRMGTEESLSALGAATSQPDARVRLAVVEALADTFQEEARDRLLAVVAGEKNPLIVAAALRGLGRYPDAAALEAIRAQLNSTSHRQRVAAAAMEAAKRRDDPALIGDVIRVLKERESQFPAEDFGDGLRTLGYLARNEDDRREVREFLTGYLNAPRRHVRVGAISALGELRDPAAIAMVGPLSGDDDEDPVQTAARRALERLRSAEAPAVQLGELRDEVADLKKGNESLKKEVEALRKRIEAGEPDGETAPGDGRRKFLGLF